MKLNSTHYNLCMLSIENGANVGEKRKFLTKNVKNMNTLLMHFLLSPTDR